MVPQRGASASEVTANILDTVPRLPGMAGESNDAFSAYTQVHDHDARRLLELQATECPYKRIRLPRHRPGKINDQLLLRKKFIWPSTGQIFQGNAKWKKSSHVGKRCKFGNACTSNSENKNKTTLFLSVYVDDIRMVGRNEGLAPMWPTLRKNIDLEDPAPSTAPKRQQPKTKNRSKQRQTCRTAQKVSAWSYAMTGHAE